MDVFSEKAVNIGNSQGDDNSKPNNNLQAGRLVPARIIFPVHVEMPGLGLFIFGMGFGVFDDFFSCQSEGNKGQCPKNQKSHSSSLSFPLYDTTQEPCDSEKRKKGCQEDSQPGRPSKIELVLFDPTYHSPQNEDNRGS